MDSASPIIGRDMAFRAILLAAAIVAASLLASPLASPLAAQPATEARIAQATTKAQAAADAASAIWWRATYKTLTNEVACNTVDVIILAALAGGGGSISTTFYVANTAVGAVAYYVHEIAWIMLGPTPSVQTTGAMAAKTVTYNLSTAAQSFVVAQAFVGNPAVSTAYMIAATFAETAVFVVNEWAWNTFADPL
jgi:uncharacterized membrane protein